MDGYNGKKSWTEYFRIITPFLLLVITGIGSSINARLSDIDTKLFRHLTNDELHCPRSMVVSKQEFDIYQEFRTKEVGSLKDELLKMERNQLEHFKVSYDNNMKLQELVIKLTEHVKSK